ncbi:DUF255 domain-containing protein [Lujinxingia vulgaris]|uniref:DUF255 domain-containing protein n=1 Tax=Lujinxingia vulgaris TaxID=2600176 RepID=A0A5C6X8J0_9DELT|nr:thioredoxin family protein [Lujinxingia vulgaris]TXD36622.1 DUF255 domain-containing protein [Lujinxingia vulgaris]
MSRLLHPIARRPSRAATSRSTSAPSKRSRFRALAMVAALAFFTLLAAPLQLSAQGLEVPEGAYAEDAFDEGDPRVEKRLILDHTTASPGRTITAGVLFEMDPKWHIYWRNSGQGGMSTEASLTASAGQISELRWPAPTVFHEAGGEIITFGYGDHVLLYWEVALPADLQPGAEVELNAEVDYLVCKVDCIPGRAELTRSLLITEAPKPAQNAVTALFAKARNATPQTTSQRKLTASLRYSKAPIAPGEDFRAELAIIGCSTPDAPDCLNLGPPPERPADAFVFDTLPQSRLTIARVSPHPTAHSGWFIELQGRTSSDTPSGDQRLSGVLKLTDDQGQPLPTFVDFLFPRTESAEAQAMLLGAGAPTDPTASPTSPAQPTENTPSIFFILLLAFAGGALLNLMPCVFPVLAIKVFSFVKLANEERQSVYVHGAAYTAGIVTSMMALAGVVIALQQLGTQVGWGFQFQEPRFIAVVGAVLVIFALNLFGVFEVTLNPGRLQDLTDAPGGLRRSFGEGVLAVVLATPCSAPFLGTAVGFALASSPLVIALIFMTLGLGLAAPFVALTLIPNTARFLPRPGPWMLIFKQFLGFALLGTVIWLLWLIGQMSGAMAQTAQLIFLLSCALAAWIWGQVQFGSSAKRLLGGLGALILIAISAWQTFDFSAEVPDPASATTQSASTDDEGIAWIPWSEEAVQAELAAGRPVFIDFTATWCITCQVNKRNVLETPEVIAAVEEHNVAMVIADWTRRDDRIRAKLAEFGKAGVPMYLLYHPDSPEDPRVLPELLTRQMVIEAFASP